VNPFDYAPATAGRQGQASSVAGGDLIRDTHHGENALARFL